MIKWNQCPRDLQNEIYDCLLIEDLIALLIASAEQKRHVERYLRSSCKRVNLQYAELTEFHLVEKCRALKSLTCKGDPAFYFDDEDPAKLLGFITSIVHHNAAHLHTIVLDDSSYLDLDKKSERLFFQAVANCEKLQVFHSPTFETTEHLGLISKAVQVLRVTAATDISILRLLPSFHSLTGLFLIVGDYEFPGFGVGPIFTHLHSLQYLTIEIEDSHTVMDDRDISDAIWQFPQLLELRIIDEGREESDLPQFQAPLLRIFAIDNHYDMSMQELEIAFQHCPLLSVVVIGDGLYFRAVPDGSFSKHELGYKAWRKAACHCPSEMLRKSPATLDDHLRAITDFTPPCQCWAWPILHPERKSKKRRISHSL